jgi:4-cresol dehydrogenase (hydroxylating)
MSPPGQPVPPLVQRAKDLLRSKDGGSAADWDKLADLSGTPAAQVTGSIRGPAKIVNATLDYARELFASLPGVTFRQDEIYRFPLDVAAIPPHERAQFGIPGLWSFSNLIFGNLQRGLYFFSPVCRAAAEDLFALKQVIREVVLEHADEATQDAFLGWVRCNTVYPQAFIFTYPFPITDNAVTNQNGRDLFKLLVEACAAKGFGEYRAHAAFQTEAMAQYSFNNHAMLRFCETIKDAIDPNGILSPGKSGIWPKRLRNART